MILEKDRGFDELSKRGTFCLGSLSSIPRIADFFPVEEIDRILEVELMELCRLKFMVWKVDVVEDVEVDVSLLSPFHNLSFILNIRIFIYFDLSRFIKALA